MCSRNLRPRTVPTLGRVHSALTPTCLRLVGHRVNSENILVLVVVVCCRYCTQEGACEKLFFSFFNCVRVKLQILTIHVLRVSVPK